MTAFYPAASERTSTPLATTRMLFQVNSNELAIQRLQQQLSTGRKFQSPSENLPAAIKVLSAQRQQEFRTQTEVNLKQADSILSVTETNLGQTQDILNQVRATAVQAASNTLSDDERTALLNQVDGALRRLAEIANSKFGDQYIFAGSKVRTDPLKLNSETVVFSANDDHLNTISDYNTVVTTNVSAQEAFGVRSNEIVGSVDLDPSVALDTPLANLNQGNGVRRGAISLGNGLENVELDLSTAHDLGDVVNKISGVTLGGRQLTATLSTNGIDIDYADGNGGLLRVDNVGSGATASDLGIVNTNSGSLSPVVGSDLNPALSLTTHLSQLFGGAGLPTGASLKITQGGKDYIVNSNSIDTVEDLLNRIERTGAKVSASIDDSGRFLQIQSFESGSQLSIGENGDSLATMLGVRTMNLDTPLTKLNNGVGISLNPNGDDLVFTRNDGTQLRINLDGAQTVGDVLDRINNDANNFDLNTRIVASLATVGNGIQLTSPAGAQQISVTNAGGSQAATGLGWTNSKTITATGSTDVNGDSVIGGQDVSGVEVEGVFNSILKLRNAINKEDYASMESIYSSLDNDLARLSIARGFVGSRQQDISSRIEKSQDQVVQLKQVESDNLDTDLASVISELSLKQASLTASLQLLGQTTRNTLFDYL
ncbi:MAG: hypothetical protein U0930_10140 [Pirellulales bacterium]